MRDDPTPNPLDSQLSAFLDGELPTGEAEFLIRRLERDGQLQQAFSRYALIGEIMRTPASADVLLAAKDFTSRVQQAVAAEVRVPASAVPEVKRTGLMASRWFKPAAGLSIAAGVAALAVGMLVEQEPAQVVTVAATAVPAADRDSSPIEASYVVPEITVTGPLLPAARLTNYVMAHSEYSSPLGRRNVLSGMLADEAAAPADDIVPAAFTPSDEPARLEQP